MEILKFSEPPKRSNRSGSAKRSGLMPMVTFGVAVLVLGGMSTTLAGTISLGTNNTVEFGQGVVNTAACDTSITVTPVSDFETSTADGFFVNSVILGGIGVGLNDTTTASLQVGCLNKVFTIRAFSATDPLDFRDTAGANPTDRISFRLPNSISGAAAGTITDKPNGTFALYTAAGSFTALTSDDGGSTGIAAGNGRITITGIRLPKSVEKITLESSS